MKHNQVSELPYLIGEKIEIKGWVETIRDQKNIQFLIIKDDTGYLQVTNWKPDNPELSDLISSLVPGSTVSIDGKVESNNKVKLNQLELIPYDIKITSKPIENIPISEDSSLENRLDNRHIDLRRPEIQLIFKVQTTAEQAMRNYWLKNGFIEIHSPKLVEGATESGAELFTLDYFGKKASLAQSPQFYKQLAMAGGMGKVFEIGPVFRANPSFTSRHDSEFTSIDMEMSWIDTHEDIMEFEERWLQYVLNEVKLKHGNQIKETYGSEVIVPSVPFPRVSMEEAYRILERQGYIIPREEKGDLDPKGEKMLSEFIKKTKNHDFLFVTEYPASARAFYHMRFPDKPEITKSFDLLMKGIEITTGAQREHRYDFLLRQAIEKGIEPSSISHYLYSFKHGCPPHGGHGFGLTRMLMKIFDLPNVREATFIYRGPNRLTP